jgi:hypothetical protein
MSIASGSQIIGRSQNAFLPSQVSLYAHSFHVDILLRFALFGKEYINFIKIASSPCVVSQN